jgi:hypothetical protein
MPKVNIGLKSDVFWGITRLRVVIVVNNYHTTPRNTPEERRSHQHPLTLDPWKLGPIRCPETSVNNYHTTPRNTSEGRRFHRHRGGSLKSKNISLVISDILPLKMFEVCGRIQ